MSISSRTPEGEPSRCPVCSSHVRVEPSLFGGDAPCPRCGTLLWFVETSNGALAFDSRATQRARERIEAFLGHKMKGERRDLRSFFEESLSDSLDLVELIMELEEEFDLRFDDADSEKIRTVGDAIALILRRIEGDSRGDPDSPPNARGG